MSTSIKELRRIGRHQRGRKQVAGTAERPRLNVFRSHKHIAVQLIDDLSGKTLLSCSSMEEQLRKQIPYGGNIAAAKELGKILAKRTVEKGFKQVVFDRGGNLYHGRVKALADAVREAGLQF